MRTFTLVFILVSSALSFSVNGSDEHGVSLLLRAEEFFEEEELLLDCVVRVFNRHFIISDREITILSSGSKDRVKGLKGISTAVVVRLVGGSSIPLTAPRYQETKAAVVIFLEGDFPRDIKTLDEALKGFDLRSRFLLATILPHGTVASARNYLNKIVEYLSENQIFFVALAVAQLGRGISPELYGYTRTAYGHCGKPRLIHFGNCRKEISLSRIFSSRVNYNRCPLRLATFEWSPMTRFVIRNGTMTSVGIESNIVNLIVESVNASTEYFNIPSTGKAYFIVIFSSRFISYSFNLLFFFNWISSSSYCKFKFRGGPPNHKFFLFEPVNSHSEILKSVSRTGSRVRI